MQFSILDRLPENAAAILFVSNGKVAPEDSTSALLLEGLAEQEYFAAARIPEGGSLKHKAVLRVADNGLPAWQKAAKEAAVAAYSDLFALLAAMAGISALVSFALWLYRRHYKIDILAKEKKAVFAMLGK